jgi:hypothetical protein
VPHQTVARTKKPLGMAYESSFGPKAKEFAAGSRAAVSRSLLLLGATVSFLLSVSLWFAGHELQGIFVGLWVPSILALGSNVLPRGERR